MSVGITETSAARFLTGIARWSERLRDHVSEIAVDMAQVAFKYVLEESPQYSGDFAANWNVDYGKSDFSFEYFAVYDGVSEPYRRGHPSAINYARARAKWRKLPHGQSIFLTNTAKHTESYALKIEHGKIKFRDVNAGAERVAARAVRFAAITGNKTSFSVKPTTTGSFV